ncbi:MAG: hypothetical protein AAFR59_08355 [Bacteroidota bacterium]
MNEPHPWNQDSFWRIVFAISNGFAVVFSTSLLHLYFYTAYIHGGFKDRWYMGNCGELRSLYNFYVDLVNQAVLWEIMALLFTLLLVPIYLCIHLFEKDQKVDWGLMGWTMGFHGVSYLLAAAGLIYWFD